MTNLEARVASLQAMVTQLTAHVSAAWYAVVQADEEARVTFERLTTALTSGVDDDSVSELRHLSDGAATTAHAARTHWKSWQYRLQQTAGQFAMAEQALRDTRKGAPNDGG